MPFRQREILGQAQSPLVHETQIEIRSGGIVLLRRLAIVLGGNGHVFVLLFPFFPTRVSLHENRFSSRRA